MRALAATTVLAVASVALGQQRLPADRCLSSCSAYVAAREVKRSSCQVCALSGGRPGAWLEQLEVLPRGVLEDGDWQVRFGAVKQKARRTRKPPERVLAEWVATTTGPERLLACLTAAAVAGAADQTLDAWLAPSRVSEPSARAACLAARAELLARAVAELGAPQPGRQRDALSLFARALEVPPARLALDGLPLLSPAADEALAQELTDALSQKNVPVGRALLAAATPADAAAMNRLLAAFARVRDERRPLLAAPTVQARKEAVRALAPLSPLSDSELRVALEDPALEVRRLAGRALAAGEGRTLEEAVRARMQRKVAATTLEQLKWLALLGPGERAGCVSLARTLWDDRTQPDTVRAEALTTLAGCGGGDLMGEIEQASGEGSAALRLGAVRAAAQVPRDGRAAAVLLEGLHSEDPGVLVAALDGLAHQGTSTATSRLAELVAHPSAEVRRRALEVLCEVDHERAEPLAAQRLREDQDSSVRAAAAEQLGTVGGPRSASALARAAKIDSDARVKFIAGQSLRKLGFPVPPGAPRP